MALTYREFSLTEDDESRRIDKVLRKFIPKMPLSLIYKALRTKKVLINGKKITGNYITCAGDLLSIEKSLFENFEKPMMKNSVLSYETAEIIFQNRHILVINKPYGLPVYASAQPSTLDLVKNTVDNSSLSFKIGPLHRLDKTTTGLLFFSQSLIGAKEFSRLLREKAIKKTYSALLCGHLTKNQNWEDKILKAENKNWTKSAVDSSGKIAITQVFPKKLGFISRIPITFAEIVILTGRAHQIRTVCAFHGFPLLGDTKYGGIAFENRGKKLFLHHTKLPAKMNCPFPKNFIVSRMKTF